jgi:high-affinity nickel-transport protein
MTLAHSAPLGIALLGLMLGMRHATDPDHVIAVTTILSRERRLSTATRIGLVWGLGHTTTVLVVGSTIILFRVAIPARAGLAMEFAVAVVLVILGIPSVGVLAGRLGAKFAPAGNSEPEALLVHSHAHSHHGQLHSHSHAHMDDAAQVIDAASDHDHLLPRSLVGAIAVGRPMLKAFAVGLVHGLAGSAAIALLVLGAIPQPLWATLYLAVFCLGTVLGMGFITTVIGAPFALAEARMARLHRGLVLASGLLSFGFGLLIAWQVGITDHLFGALPHWTPQ